MRIERKRNSIMHVRTLYWHGAFCISGMRVRLLTSPEANSFSSVQLHVNDRHWPSQAVNSNVETKPSAADNNLLHGAASSNTRAVNYCTRSSLQRQTAWQVPEEGRFDNRGEGDLTGILWSWAGFPQVKFLLLDIDHVHRHWAWYLVNVNALRVLVRARAVGPEPNGNILVLCGW